MEAIGAHRAMSCRDFSRRYCAGEGGGGSSPIFDKLFVRLSRGAYVCIVVERSKNWGVFDVRLRCFDMKLPQLGGVLARGD